jgi:hypothetical protein
MQSLIDHLSTSRDAFLAELHGLSPVQWSFKPAPDRWSIFEVTEHVASVELGVNRLLTRQLFAEPATPEQKAQARGKDELVVAALKDRTNRMDAPESVRPTGRWPTPAEAIASFEDSRNGTIQFLRQNRLNLRDYCAPHPLLQTLDGHQWMLYTIGHVDRHREQIQEIKNLPAFPPS